MCLPSAPGGAFWIEPPLVIRAAEGRIHPEMLRGQKNVILVFHRED